MSSLNAVGRSAAANKNDRSAAARNDRVSLCTFTFSDGRRCRSLRNDRHSHFCFEHAQKEARARAAQNLGKDLDYFFSGDYLSACDLSTALARLIPAVIRGEVKPRAARTVACLAQTLMQAIHISQHEYINAFGTDGWRKSIRNSVDSNHDYRFTPNAPAPLEGLTPNPNDPDGSTRNASEKRTPTEPEVPSSARPEDFSPSTLMPPTTAEFAQQVLAGLNASRPAQETAAVQPASVIGLQADTALPPQPAQPTALPLSCHSERSGPSAFGTNLRSEESAFSSSQAPSQTEQPGRPVSSAPPSPEAGYLRSLAPPNSFISNTYKASCKC